MCLRQYKYLNFNIIFSFLNIKSHKLTWQALFNKNISFKISNITTYLLNGLLKF